MMWEHPGTQRYFTRADDKLVRLKHRNADESRSEVIHIPKHVIDEMRPGFYAHRLDIRFHRTKAVDLPEDLAKWVLEKFKYVYRVNEPAKAEEVKTDYTSLSWSDLCDKAKEIGVYKPFVKREKLLDLIKEKEGRDDISTSNS